jgi:hypothetical protein
MGTRTEVPTFSDPWSEGTRRSSGVCDLALAARAHTVAFRPISCVQMRVARGCTPPLGRVLR